MVRSIRQSLTLFLLAALPFHAFFVTFWTNILVGPGHSPLFSLAIWKEVVLMVILILCIVEVLWVNEQRVTENQKLRLDLLDLLIVALLGLSLFTTTLHSSLFTLHFALGFKYDFLPLIAFLILRRVSWNAAWKRTVLLTLLLVSVSVAVIGLITLPLPSGVFTMLGYSPAHSTYIPSGPLAEFQLLSDTGLRRIQSTFAGPNQFGIYLLLPWSIGVLAALGAFRSPLIARGSADRLRHLLPHVAQSSVLFAIGIAGTLLFTYSRSAWLGAIVILLVALWLFKRSAEYGVGPKQAPKPPPRDESSHLVALLLAACALASLVIYAPVLPLRSTTLAHLTRPVEAIRIILQEPYGRGLGSAGPAQHRVSDVCLHYPLGADTQWAKLRPDLCIFRGGYQVQPRNRDCRCPVIPESWYLQIGVELGVLGLLLYVILIILTLKKLSFHVPRSTFHSLSTLFFLGVVVAGLFLHSFEDSAVAYTAWVLAAVALPKRAKFRM